MRLDTEIRRARNKLTRYLHQIQHPHYTAADAGQRLASTFGQCAHQLPPSLRIELLSPHLQHYAHRKSLFENLQYTGQLLLSIQVNDQLGTRNVNIPDHVMQQFCDVRGIGTEVGTSNGPNLLYQGIGAVNVFLGDAQCRDMISRHILDGSQGLANMFLDDLARRN